MYGFVALAEGDVELDGLTVGQRRAASLDVRDVHEQVVVAAQLDEEDAMSDLGVLDAAT